MKTNENSIDDCLFHLNELVNDLFTIKVILYNDIELTRSNSEILEDVFAQLRLSTDSLFSVINYLTEQKLKNG